LTTTVSRICLDQLRTRSSRREEPSSVELSTEGSSDPEHEALLADSVGGALQAVLATLRPGERVAFVLHDVFAVPFEEIGAILGRSPAAAKQLASRARARLHGSGAPPEQEVVPAAERRVVDAFLAASRAGNLAALITVLDPEIVLHADPGAVRMGSPEEVRGSEAVAGVFSGRALGAQPALIDGAVGIAWAPEGTARVVWELAIDGGKVTRIDMLAAADTLADLELTLLANAD
jgi:RNA polymerase sigma-70 factor (ECF subfamily)